MQEKIFSYKADDSTYMLNKKLLGIITPGLYRGFDVVSLPNDLNLSLVHTATGSLEYDSDQAMTARTFGIVQSKQGVTIKEDAIVSLPITATAAEPRVDLIVMEHKYEFVTGGYNAVYKVLQGTPSATPQPPVLTDEKTQVILGQIYMPANCSALNQSGVVWTRSETPYYADDNRWQAQIDQVNQDLNTVNTNLTNQINTVQSNLNSVESSLTNDINTVQSNLNSVESSLTNQINTVQSNLNSVNSNLQGQINTTNTNLGNLQTQVDNLDTDIANQLATKVDKVPGYGLSQEDFTTTLLQKLNGIASNANNYSHPSTHPITIITDGGGYVKMTSSERTKLAGISTNANNYTHPSTHPVSMITGGNNAFNRSFQNATYGGSLSTVSRGDHRHRMLHNNVTIINQTMSVSGQNYSVSIQLNKTYIHPDAYTGQWTQENGDMFIVTGTIQIAFPSNFVDWFERTIISDVIPSGWRPGVYNDGTYEIQSVGDGFTTHNFIGTSGYDRVYQPFTVRYSGTLYKFEAVFPLDQSIGYNDVRSLVARLNYVGWDSRQ